MPSSEAVAAARDLAKVAKRAGHKKQKISTKVHGAAFGKYTDSVVGREPCDKWMGHIPYKTPGRHLLWSMVIRENTIVENAEDDATGDAANDATVIHEYEMSFATSEVGAIKYRALKGLLMTAYAQLTGFWPSLRHGELPIDDDRFSHRIRRVYLTIRSREELSIPDLFQKMLIGRAAQTLDLADVVSANCTVYKFRDMLRKRGCSVE
jgi:hypothetical protein